MIFRQKSTPRTSTCPTTTTTTTIPASPRRRRKPPNPWVMSWILQRQEKGCYSNLPADLIHSEISGYQKFVRMTHAFLTLEGIHQHIKKSVTNFRKPLEGGLKVAIMLRHLASLLNCRTNICTTPLALMSGKELIRSSEPDGMSQCFRAIKWQHIAMKKQ